MRRVELSGALFLLGIGVVAASCSLIRLGIHCHDENDNGLCDENEGIAGATATGGNGGTTTSSGGSAGSAGSTSSSAGGGGNGGTTTSSGGSGGSVGGQGGSPVGGAGGSGGTPTGGSGGSGGAVPVLGLTFSYPGHAGNERLGISGSVDRPAGPDLVSNGMLPLPGCIAPLVTDQSVSCDVGDYVAGTILDIDPAGYKGDGTFLFFHCDPSNLPGALCVGSFSVTQDGATIATCTDPPQGACSYTVNASSGRIRWHLVLP